MLSFSVSPLLGRLTLRLLAPTLRFAAMNKTKDYPDNYYVKTFKGWRALVLKPAAAFDPDSAKFLIEELCVSVSVSLCLWVHDIGRRST